MNYEEIMDTPYGEMLDMISCFAIYEGGAEEKPAKISWADAMRMK